MAAVPIPDVAQLTKESLELPRSQYVPPLQVGEQFDFNRSLHLVVPLDSTQATWVQYEESPTFLNSDNTRFIVKAPLPEDTPPRLSFYLPHDNNEVLNRDVVVSVVKDHTPYEHDEASMWTVQTIKTPREILATGLLVHKDDSGFTLRDPGTSKETEFSWPNSRITLERYGPFRTGVGAAPVLFGRCPAGLPTPIGVRYALPECLSARLSYMVDLMPGDGAYRCVLQQHYTVVNNSNVSFSRVSAVAIAGETTHASVDGHLPRGADAVSSSLYSVRETMIDILPHSQHVFISPAATAEETYVTTTITSAPPEVGQFSTVHTDLWVPSEALTHGTFESGVMQLRVNTGNAPHYDSTHVTFWERLINTRSKFTRISFRDGRHAVVARCLGRDPNNVQAVLLAVSGTYQKGTLVVFDFPCGVYVMSGARPVIDYPWQEDSSLYAVFALNEIDQLALFSVTTLSNK